MLKNRSFIFILFLFISFTGMENVYASAFQKDLASLEEDLKNFKLISAREMLSYMQLTRLSKEEWLKLRDVIHRYPRIGLDVMLKFDQYSPFGENKVDKLIKQADKLMMDKKFRQAAFGYQEILKFITKNKKFKNGRNKQLYWSLIHSLARAFYALKQYDDAFIVYKSIPNTYPFFKQVQFELMWNNYMNDKLEFALGSIASMSTENFSKILEPEVYLVQYYIYKRLCRTKDAEFVKKRVLRLQKALQDVELPLGSWIKKDVVTLMYKQILNSGELNNEETSKLKSILESEKNKDFDRMQKEIDLVTAHIELDSGSNTNLKLKTNLIPAEEILGTQFEGWPYDEIENWPDEVGNYVYTQKDLCKIEQ